LAQPLRLTPLAVLVALGGGCGSSPSAATAEPLDAAAPTVGVDGAGGTLHADAEADAAGADAGKVDADDAGAGQGDAGTDAGGPFVTRVVSFAPTDCAGFGAASLPRIVEGPPIGGGTSRGSTDVVSLGSGGRIVVGFDPNAIVDGPGPDFVVFENPFWVGGNSNDIYAEPGEVSVSDDGETWYIFPCTPTVDPQSALGTGTAPPYGACAGWHVVYSTPQNGISPFDPSAGGGDPYDLADVGLKHARFVRIVDMTEEACPDAGSEKPTTNGFDLDAIAILHAEQP
jgi:hypothetical protein